MTKNLLVFLLSGLLLPVLSHAQFREYSNEFLNIGAGARGMAMGNAQVASVSDGTAGYWNPAGLAAVKDHPNINLMYSDYFSGIGNYIYTSVAIPIQDNKRTLGVSLLRFAVDDIPNTLFLVQPDGTINYNNIQTFSSADYALLLSYGQYLKQTENEKISFGFNAKIIRRVVGSFANAWGFGLDAAFQMQKGRWRIGAVARDITTTFNAWTFSFTDQEKQVLYLTNNDIPVKSTELTAPRLILGGGYDFRINKTLSLLAEANADLTFGSRRNTLISSSAVSVDPHIGVELGINKVFFVRAGVTNFQQALADGDTLNQKKVWIYQPSLGAGIKLGNVTIDYALSNLANQTSSLYTNVFSLKLDLIDNKKHLTNNEKE
ncbi:putative type IX sorting system protein PorV2 [Ferruginibacter albus]|uniref:putative type IX sorting system protein PorV2 n=1 Tax=Ferruginibacter albus TaxID=2875540 RepID=UPI001CC7F175|nr:PorV/PorQ family protein [Ferruginibacter albus]UAY51503.1 PorV/PorQ family protein [Ferruginibacter albus]